MTARHALMAGSATLGVIAALALGSHTALASTSRAVAVGSGPATLTVGTVPKLPGVQVILDGVTHLTNSDGTVTIATFAGRHQLDIRPPSKHEVGTGVRFTRWLDGIALASRTLHLHQGANREEAGFELSYPISIRFATKGGRPVPMSAISSVTFANSLGARFTFTPSDPPSLLAANRIVRVQSGLYPQPIRYSVRIVLFGRANVVYAGSQNFFVHPSQVWTIKLLLFTMRIEVRDALFGFPIGSAVRIRMSDGASRIVKLDAHHAVMLPNMPRATYDLVAKGPGFGLSAPATLTKPLAAKLLLLSWVDISAVVAFFALFILGLPLLGGRIIRRKGRRIRLLAWQAGHLDQVEQPADAGLADTDPADVGPADADPADAGPADATVRAADLAPNAVDEALARVEPVTAVVDPAPLAAVFGGNPVVFPATFSDSPAQQPIAGGDNKESILEALPEQDDVTEILPAIVASIPDTGTGPDSQEPGRRA